MLLKDVCIENYADVGLYGVKFFINGKWATVIVDDRIPCEKVGSGWKPIFASPKVHCVCESVCVCVCSFVCLLVCMSRPLLYAYQFFILVYIRRIPGKKWARRSCGL